MLLRSRCLSVFERGYGPTFFKLADSCTQIKAHKHRSCDTGCSSDHNRSCKVLDASRSAQHTGRWPANLSQILWKASRQIFVKRNGTWFSRGLHHSVECSSEARQAAGAFARENSAVPKRKQLPERLPERDLALLLVAAVRAER